ncbi:unnamed protein product [Arctogadus glacialis]
MVMADHQSMLRGWGLRQGEGLGAGASGGLLERRCGAQDASFHPPCLLLKSPQISGSLLGVTAEHAPTHVPVGRAPPSPRDRPLLAGVETEEEEEEEEEEGKKGKSCYVLMWAVSGAGLQGNE